MSVNKSAVETAATQTMSELRGTKKSRIFRFVGCVAIENLSIKIDNMIATHLLVGVRRYHIVDRFQRLLRATHPTAFAAFFLFNCIYSRLIVHRKFS